MIVLALSFQSGLDFGEYNVVAGKLYLDRREFDKAIAYLEKYLNAFPEAPNAAEATIDLAAAYEKKGDADKAISALPEIPGTVSAQPARVERSLGARESASQGGGGPVPRRRRERGGVASRGARPGRREARS